jgi:two-component system sensor histidine kinase BaeS
MVAMVAGALIVAGLFTLLLTVVSTRNQTRTDLVRQADGVASGFQAQGASLANRAGTRGAARPGGALKTLLNALKAPLKLQDEAVVAVGDNGRVFDVDRPLQPPPPLPSGLNVADLRPAYLLAGHTVSGRKGAIVYAVAPFKAEVLIGSGPSAQTMNLTQAVILTRRPPTGVRVAGLWFLLVSAVTLAVAVLVANRLGRRIARPLVAAEATTRRIAGGDLAAKVPVPRRADPETASLARSINTMAEGLSQSKRLEHQFLMSVSHDLRTPLTSIRGFAEAIADGAATDVSRAAGVIAAESRRLERLVGDLLDLARLDARRFSFDIRSVNLGEVVSDTGESFRPAADDLGLALVVEGGAGAAPMVRADPDRLAQVVANLVENALKYAKTTVRVATSLGEAQAVIWVDDDGPGIAADDLPHVFDRLFLSSRYPARQVGSGLGLAIVAELVHAMGGTVRAESPLWPTGGTRMVVTLPMWSDSNGAGGAAGSEHDANGPQYWSDQRLLAPRHE